jgi:hypothetical protein
LLCLGIQQPLRLSIEMLSFFFLCVLHHSRAYVIAGIMRTYLRTNISDMQLRVGLVGQFSSGLDRHGCLFGAISGCQDLGREDADFALRCLDSSQNNRSTEDNSGQAAPLTAYRLASPRLALEVT